MVSQFNDRELRTDFWWLSPEEARQYRYVDLFHQEPYSDEPNTNKDPLPPKKWNGSRTRLEDIHKRTLNFRNKNVFRSWTLYDCANNGGEIIGPFLLDIDRVIKQGAGHPPDLDTALKDTRLLIQEYCSNSKDGDYRIFFTGHKGFHIEIRPGAIGLQTHMDRRAYFEKRRKEVNNHFGNGFVDPFHEHIRLHNSINVWIDYSGQLVCRMKFEITRRELDSLSIDEICSQSKRLATDYLELQ